MNNFKNMKIEVNAEQPLDDIVGELERLGYRWCVDTKHNYSTKCIVTFTNGSFDFFYGASYSGIYKAMIGEETK